MQLTFITLTALALSIQVLVKGITLNIIIENENTGGIPYLQLLKKGGRKDEG